jgi:hypothetical protein
MLRGVPVPQASGQVWQGIFKQNAHKHWEQSAQEHGLSREQMFAHPTASVSA